MRQISDTDLLETIVSISRAIASTHLALQVVSRDNSIADKEKALESAREEVAQLLEDVESLLKAQRT